MAWFKKKTDPLAERSRALEQEIAELQARIRKLNSQAQPPAARPHLRSTALPQGGLVTHEPTSDAPLRPAPPPEPVFEPVDQTPLMDPAAAPPPEALYNKELGIRKYDLVSALRRLREHFRGPTASNPKLVSYLAAGSFQGLQPLRKEKRVARNRLLVLATILFLVLLGIGMVFLRGR